MSCGMATFFGEIVLPSSRVFFDDSDDEENSSPEGSHFEVSEVSPGSLGAICDLLIIAEGNVARGFVTTHLIEEGAIPVAQVRQIHSGNLQRQKQEEPSRLFNLNNETRLLEVGSSIDLVSTNSLTTEIEPALKAANKVLILCNQPLADYRCDSLSNLPSSFLRVLKTSSWKEPVAQRSIEQPNFISGFPASVVTWCEASSKPSLTAVCISDTSHADSITVKPFIDFFASSSLSSLLRRISGPVSYKKTTTKPLEESNMYL